jgi:hypothetical protein
MMAPMAGLAAMCASVSALLAVWPRSPMIANSMGSLGPGDVVKFATTLKPQPAPPT